MLHCDKNMNIKYQFGGNKKLQIDNPDSLYINIIYQLQKHYDYCKINTIQNIVILFSKSRFKDFLLPKMQKYNRKGTSKPKELTMRMGRTAHQ